MTWEPSRITQDRTPRTLHLTPELLTILRQAGVDLLAYDSGPCSEAAGPLAEAARRIEADPDLCHQLRLALPAGSENKTGSNVTEILRWAVESFARHPDAPLRVRIHDEHSSNPPSR